MANVTPPPRIPYQARRFMQIPRTGGEEGRPARIPHEAGGGGSNPLRGVLGQGGADVGYVQDTPFVGGLLGALGMDRSIALENTQRRQAASDAQQAKVQAGVDAYMQRVQSGATPEAALAQVFHPDNEGHVHFTDPQTFKSILQLHSVMAAVAQPGSPISPKSFVKLPDGTLALPDPQNPTNLVPLTVDGQTMQGKPTNTKATYFTGADGKKYVATSDNPTLAKPVMAGGASAALQYDSQGNVIPGSAAQAGPQQLSVAAGKPAKALTMGEENALTAQSQAMDALLKMQQNSGAAGAFGYGALERGLAMHTPLSPEQASAFNQGYNELRQAMAQMPGSSRLKAAFEAKMATLPNPNNAQAWNDRQSIPAMINQIRTQIGDEYRTFAQEGKSTATVADMAKNYDADPNYMSMLHGALTKLQQTPTSLTGPEVQALQYEMGRNTLTGDAMLRTTRQLYQRGMMPKGDFDKLVQTNPSLNQISPIERISPDMRDANGEPLLRQPPDVIQQQRAAQLRQQGGLEAGGATGAQNTGRAFPNAPATAQPSPGTNPAQNAAIQNPIEGQAPATGGHVGPTGDQSGIYGGTAQPGQSGADFWQTPIGQGINWLGRFGATPAQGAELPPNMQPPQLQPSQLSGQPFNAAGVQGAAGGPSGAGVAAPQPSLLETLRQRIAGLPAEAQQQPGHIMGTGTAWQPQQPPQGQQPQAQAPVTINLGTPGQSGSQQQAPQQNAVANAASSVPDNVQPSDADHAAILARVANDPTLHQAILDASQQSAAGTQGQQGTQSGPAPSAPPPQPEDNSSAWFQRAMTAIGNAASSGDMTAGY